MPCPHDGAPGPASQSGMLQDHADAKAAVGKVATDVFTQLLGATACIAEDVMISPGSFTKAWTQLIVRFVMPLPVSLGA